MKYEQLLSDALAIGDRTVDRTGVGTMALYGATLRYTFPYDGFPAITGKRVHMRSVWAELLWMLSGSTNVRDLQAMGCSIWDEWAGPAGDLGPIYGAQWRGWGSDMGSLRQCTLDQIANLVDSLRRDPHSRRHLVSAWNVADLRDMALAPCHFAFQCHVDSGRGLWLQAYQRSADLFLGVPFNLASYATLCHMLAQQCDLTPRGLIWSGGNVHLYSNHVEQAELLLSREPRPLPQLVIKRRPGSIFDYRVEDFELAGYDPHPHIAAPVAV